MNVHHQRRLPGVEQDGEPPETSLAWPPDPPEPNEGLLSWLMREAAEQDVPSLGVILRRATPRTNLLAEQRVGGRLDAVALAEATLTERAVVEALLYPAIGDARADDLDARVDFRGVSVPRWHLTAKRRYSPTTLRKLGFALSAWEYKFLPFCPDSFEYLTNRCPHADCTARLDWHWAVGVDVCSRCGGELAVRPRRTTPEAWLPNLRLLAAILSCDAEARAEALDTLPPALRGAEAGDVLELIHAVFPFCGQRPLTRSTSRWWQRRPIRLSKTLSEAAGLVLGWPGSVLASLASIDGRVQGNPHAAARRPFKLKAVREGGWAANAILDLRESLRSHDGGRSAGSATAYSILTSARILSTGTATVSQARRAGRLRAAPMMKRAELVLGLEKADVDAAAVEMRGRISVWRAAKVFGVPSYAIEDLVTLGEIATVQHPYVVARYGPDAIDGADFNRFLNNLASKCEADLDDPVPLAHVMRGIGGRPKPWAAVLASVGRGDIRARVGPDGKVSATSVLVSASQTDKLRLHPSAATGVSRNMDRRFSRGDALEILNLNIKKSADLQAWHGRPESQIAGSRILELAAEFLSPIEAEAKWGISYRVAERLMRHSTPAVSYGPFGWNRSGFEAALSHAETPDRDAPQDRRF